jgi:gliding motility-associated-like protein
MYWKHLLFTLLFGGSLVTVSGQTYVRANATGANDGSSWADAYRNLQDALADPTVTELWIARGTYRPVACNTCGESERQVAFELRRNLAVYGGFAGNETQRSERNVLLNPTILSGDIGNPIDSTDNSFQVVRATDVDETLVLDGLIIQEGNSDGTFDNNGYGGGGILIDAAFGGEGSLVMRRCTIRNNFAGGGGGLQIRANGGSSIVEPLIEDCVFEGNTASLGNVSSSGGAVFIFGQVAAVNPVFIGCTFRNNRCGGNAGALAINNSNTLGTELIPMRIRIDSCLFEGNRSGSSAGAVIIDPFGMVESQSIIQRTIFRDNHSENPDRDGGALYLRSRFDGIMRDRVVNCDFINNSSQNHGGAIVVRGSQDGTNEAAIINCTFRQNRAASTGGAIYHTSFLANQGTVTNTIINSTFYQNKADSIGGAIFYEAAQGTTSSSIQNSIFWQDSSGVQANAVAANGGNITVQSSLIEQDLNGNLVDGGANIQGDPFFAKAEAGNLHLLPNSPALNTGNNDLVPDDVDRDRDGDPRINGNVEMGAYENVVRYVDEDAAGAETGDSWTDAHSELRDALQVVQPGDEVWIAEGEYHPTECTECTVDQRNIAFEYPDAVALYGGFRGTELQRDQRDWEQFRSILSGDIGNPGDSLDNSLQVIRLADVDTFTILDGLIIEAGNADESFAEGFESSGGGLFVDATFGQSGSPSLRNCTFRNNFAGGGGAFAVNGSGGGTIGIRFFDCTFDRNSSSLGRVFSFGGAGHIFGSGAIINTAFIRSAFTDNICGNDGGALSISASIITDDETLQPHILIDSCLFEGNKALSTFSAVGGAFFLRATNGTVTNTTIANSRFLNNSATGDESDAGAVYLRASFSNAVSKGEIANCYFEGNTASRHGGAIMLRGSQEGTSQTRIINSAFVNNSAEGQGGAVYMTANRSGSGEVVTRILQSSFANNQAGQGGALFIDAAEGVGECLVANSIIWDNFAGQDQRSVSDSSGVFQFRNVILDSTIQYPDTQMVIRQDPAWLNPTEGDLRISACSPAIGLANPAFIPSDTFDLDENMDSTELWSLDLSAQARQFEQTQDLGAYEWTGTPTRPVLELVNQQDACSNSSPGEVTLQASEVFAPYRVTWSDGDTSLSRADLDTGMYTVVLTDQAGCTDTLAVTINDLGGAAAAIQGDNVLCEGKTLDLSITGFDTYTWSTGETTETITVNQAGTYFVDATSEEGCTGSDTIVVTEEGLSPLVITGGTTLCPGSEATLSTTEEYNQYNWSDGSSDSLLLVSEPGTYRLTVTSAGGCQDSTDITVEEAERLTPVIEGDLFFCESDSTILTVGNFDNISWSRGDTSTAITVAQAGMYSVSVSDATGCTGDTSVEVVSLSGPEAIISGPSTICPGAPITLTTEEIDGIYEWSTGAESASIAVSEPGMYSVTITDEAGCRDSTLLEVTESGMAMPVIMGSEVLCSGDSTVLSVTGFQEIVWSTGDTTESITVTTPGMISVDVVQSGGCSGSDTVTITTSPGPEAIISGPGTVCTGSSITLSGGGPEAFTYLWSTGDTSSSISVMQGGSYSLTITDANGCQDDAGIDIVESDVLRPMIAGITAICNGESTELSIGNFDQITWSTGETTPGITVTEPGIISVAVSQEGGCSGADSVVISVGQTPVVSLPPTQTICPGEAATLRPDGTFSTYQWSDGSTSSSISVEQAGTYRLTVTNEAGCTVEASTSVEQDDLPPASVDEDRSVCDPTTDLMGNLPAGTTGQWSTNSGATISDPTEALTMVGNLPEGTSAFTWILSTEACPEYSQDEVAITLPDSPVAEDDVFTYQASEGPVYPLPLTQNDDLPEGTIAVQPIGLPSGFEINTGRDGERIIQIPVGAFGNFSFSYEICATDCPVLCDTAQVTIDIPFDAEDIEVPNGITPNGDGLNDAFVVDLLDNANPELYPDNRFTVFNRWNDVVYDVRNYANDWQGTNEQSNLLPAGTYYYILRLNIAEGIIIRGDVTIVR